MSRTQYTLKIKNGKSGVVKDLLDDFGFVCLEGASYPIIDNFKDLDKTSWYDEDGDDVYMPSRRRKEAFSISIPIGCEGNRGSGGMTVRQQYEALERYLSGEAGALSADGMSVYMPMEQCGYNGCYISEISDKEYQKRGDYEILTCKLVFNVSNPNDKWTM